MIPQKAKFIREEVFIKEQGFIDEFDEIDDFATHLVFSKDNHTYGTCRFFKDSNDVYVLGRIAILKPFRCQGLSNEILNTAESEIKKLGGKKILISAQYRLKKFYESCGYTAFGDIYLDEHTEHIKMQKDIT